MAPGKTIASGLDLALSTIQGWTKGFYELLPNLIVGIGFLFVAGVIAYVLRRSVAAYFNRKDRMDLGRILAGLCFWTVFLLGILIALTIILGPRLI